VSDDLTMPKCPGHACDHVLCIEQRRMLEELTAERQAREQLGVKGAAVALALKEECERQIDRAEQAEQERDRLRTLILEWEGKGFVFVPLDDIRAALAPQDGQP
jgi:hypothetical protein